MAGSEDRSVIAHGPAELAGGSGRPVRSLLLRVHVTRHGQWMIALLALGYCRTVVAVLQCGTNLFVCMVQQVFRGVWSGAMGKKGKWFGAVKKVFSPESKEKKEERQRRKSAASNPTPLDLTPSTSLEVNVSVPPPPAPPALHQIEEIRVPEAEQEQSKHVTVEEAPVAPAQASVLPPGVPSEELAAIKIQTAFRGYLARRALRALRGLVRLKSLVEGDSVRRQSASTLRCMQTLSRVQSQIRSRRAKMSEENQALQRQLLLKQELENFRSERPRRHSIATSTVRDDESLASSPSLPSYMVPTESARAKSRLQGSALTNGAETPEKGSSAGPVKKRLSFQGGTAAASPMRRHSGPPKVDSAPPQPEALVINGGSDS
ncbi:hypothetical protein C2845_PM06G08400 [Panicum miliaceum]|uniref:DUF4005 domain-containing protein n=1 Tax=Panicum miliaceum TaxID=4540 RepID=A0A3L6RAR0_PANMI|nr:hypothetical protein C2845_PM06G08400 [Panicum miliaceum]